MTYLLCRNQDSFKNRRGDQYRIVIRPRALTASSGLAPWSMAVDRHFGQRKEKSNRSWGSRGRCPLGLPPPLEERGSYPRNFHANSKNSKGFLQSRHIILDSSLLYRVRILPRVHSAVLNLLIQTFVAGFQLANIHLGYFAIIRHQAIDLSFHIR